MTKDQKIKLIAEKISEAKALYDEIDVDSLSEEELKTITGGFFMPHDVDFSGEPDTELIENLKWSLKSIFTGKVFSKSFWRKLYH